MKEVTLGTRVYRIRTVQSGPDWMASAESVDTGDRFGPAEPAPTEHGAAERVERGLQWQYEHASALEALQPAESAYDRTIAGSAFANPAEEPSAIELQKESLEQLEAARLRLDEVRERRPQ